ncbi:MAG: hypothetical protein AAGA92_08695 [Planctomycetota bacterium]
MLLAGLVLTPIVGCDTGPRTFSVEGSVTYEGEPVRGGLINFVASGGKPLGGGLGEDGTFRFELPAGTYEVRVATPVKFPDDYVEGQPLPELPPPQVPERFGRYGSSGMSLTVTGDEDPQKVDFSLP